MCYIRLDKRKEVTSLGQEPRIYISYHSITGKGSLKKEADLDKTCISFSDIEQIIFLL
jgi:hypothetical protein